MNNNIFDFMNRLRLNRVSVRGFGVAAILVLSLLLSEVPAALGGGCSGSVSGSELTPCEPSAIIHFDCPIIKGVNSFSYAAGWSCMGDNWNWDDDLEEWIHSGSSGDVWVNPFADSDGLVTRSLDAKPQTATVTATIRTCSYSGGSWICTDASVPYTFQVTNPDGCGGSCSDGDSGGGPSPGSGAVNNNLGPDVAFGLGRFSRTQTAGVLAIRASTPSASLAQPSTLSTPFEPASAGVTVDVVKDGGGVIQQVRPPQGLINVFVLDSFKYLLQFFYDQNVTAKSGGRYGTNADAYLVWTVENPDRTTNNNRLLLTENRPGTASRSFLYSRTNDSGIYKWVLTDSGGLRDVWSWEAEEPGNSGYTNVVREIRQGSTLFEKTVRTYTLLSGKKIFTRLQEGDGDVVRTTTTSYNSPELVQRIDKPDGQWEHNVYDGDGRLITKYSAYGNYAPPSVGVTPDPLTDHCKLTEYSYSAEVSGDNVDFAPWLPRREVVSVPVNTGSGWTVQEISRLYRSVPSAQTNEQWRCPVPGAGWSDSGNLYSRTVRFADASNSNTRDQIKVRISEDGTATIYDYQTNSSGVLTNIVKESGEPNNSSNPTSIVNGTRTETLLDPLSRVLRTRTRAIVSSSASVILGQETNMYSGPLLLDYASIDLGNRTNQYAYACCGLQSVIDPDGVVTTFDYDTLRRSIARLVVRGEVTGIKYTNLLDPAGRVLETRRIGTNGVAITQSRASFDVLGRAVRDTNALGGITFHTNRIVSSRLCLTNVYPDGGTRIETFYRDGRPESISGTAAAPVGYYSGAEQDGTGGPWREITLEVKLDSTGGTNEWTKTYTDGVGRPYKTVYAAASAPYPYRETTYNGLGQRVTERDPDGVTTLFAYSSQGEMVRSGVDMDQNGSVDETDGNTGQDDDRITDALTDVLASGATGNSRGMDIRRSRKFAFTTMDSIATNLIATIEISTDGLRMWKTQQRDATTAATTSEQRTVAVAGFRTNTVTEPDGSRSTDVFQYGRLASTTRYDSSTPGVQLTKTVYAYDAHGRVASATDARNGATTYTYNDADQVVTTTSPNPGLGPLVTTSSYDNMGRVTDVVQPDNTSAINEYFVTGLLKKVSGSRTYPVEYSYDAQGRMKTMKTWQNFAGNSGTATTTWNYNPYRGWLSSKYYPDATTGAAGTSGPAYTYTSAGRFLTRVWERGVTTTYAYNNAGDLSSVTYSGGSLSTPSTTFTYDRRGRRATVLRNSTTTSYTYNDAGEILIESNSGGTLAGLIVTNTFDASLRRTAVALSNQPATLVKFAYDTGNRLQYVTNGSSLAAYSYLTNSPLVSQIAFSSNSTFRMTTTKQYDTLNRLTSISSLGSGPSASVSPVRDEYIYNAASQRVRAYREDGSYWVYQYDALGQVTSGDKYWPDGTLVEGQDFEYAFDDAGKRTSTGGRASAQSSYTGDRLSRYSHRGIPDKVDVLGVANPTAGVKVNGITAARRGEYFHYPLTVNNEVSAYATVTVESQYGSGQSESGKVYVPLSTEYYTYDEDGNLASDDRWTYSWDGENRLVQMVRNSSTPAGARQKLDFEYDYLGRRVRKQFSTYSSGWVEQSDTICVYDGWNLIAEMDANAGEAMVRSYAWGLDLSGSGQDGGGVGGLLMVTDMTGAAPSAHFAAYDGNGNVAALFSATDGAVSAIYEYGPFGEALRSTGWTAKKNPFRFSTKYGDAESGLAYYGLRYYGATLGRWLSRDPIGEEAFLTTFIEGKSAREQAWIRERSLDQSYLFCQNSPVGSFDMNGAFFPIPPLPGLPSFPLLPNPIIVSLIMVGRHATSPSKIGCYGCFFIFPTWNRVPAIPLFFGPCLTETVGDFVLTALVGNITGNRAACKALYDCYKNYWK